jgi:Tol biopolymer transport system component
MGLGWRTPERSIIRTCGGLIDLPTAEKRTKPGISRLTSGTSFYGDLSFSPDGRWIAFALGPNRDETNIFKKPVDGGEPVQLKTHEEKTIIRADPSVGWVWSKPVISSDGRKIAVGWNRKNGGLWIVSLEPYSETLLLSGDHFAPAGWSPDGKYVYAIRGAGSSSREIIRVKVAAPNEVTSVAILPGNIDPISSGASVSPDGHEIVVSVVEEKSDVWLMENFDPSPR